jgi:eukaryotic-like serine/threonine-protein kinase
LTVLRLGHIAVFQVNQKVCNGRYTILGVKGEGRFGITYTAENAEGRLIIIKTLNDVSIHGQDCERLQDALVREACKLVRCRSSYIVEAEDLFREDQIWCIPMEYIPGESLESYVLSKKYNKISPEEALDYINQITQALEEVHRHDLLHLDVRPANILLRIQPRKVEAVLIDFGFARKLNDPISRARSKEIVHGFAPPEFYSSNPEIDVQTDIYSLGATLYFLLVGKPPIPAKDRDCSAGLEFPETVDNYLKQAIVWAMSMKIKDRPKSVQQWRKEGLRILNRADGNSLSDLAIGNKNNDVIKVDSAEVEMPSKIPGLQSKDYIWKFIIPAIAVIITALGGLGGLAALIKELRPVSAPSSIPSIIDAPQK